MALAAVALLGFTTPSQASYVLAWSDEFDGTSLDTSNWNIDIGNGCPSLCGWGNNELQYYRSENVSVTGGNLVLTAKRENFGGNAFTSGKVHTRNKQSFLYGRIEMRAKIPTGGGMWPAFWMMPQDDAYGGWAASGEIDIMESSNNTTSVGGALHFGGQYPDNTSTSGSYSLGGANFADEFHVYAIEWEPTQIRWYVDGAHYMTRVNTQWWSAGASGNPLAPFDQDFYLILNAAVGGWYTGCTNPSCITANFPQEYLIDYVRVYEDVENFEPEVTITTPIGGSTVPVGDILIEADATDQDGTITKVEFFNGGALLGEDDTAPYSYNWTAVGDGCYQIIAKATDDLGGFGTDTVEIIVGTGCGQEPYYGTPFQLPAKIEAEDYDIGGQNIAYYDTDAGNNGGQYRTDEDVDIESCADAGGGYNVGWLPVGEWIEYTVNVPVAGAYTIEVRSASPSLGGKCRITFGGVDKTGEMILPVTGSWQTWGSTTTNVTLDAGVQIMRLTPTYSGFNLNYFDITGDVAAIVPGVDATGYALHPCYPNPFNPMTTISFDLPVSAKASLTVYDVAGKTVQRLVAAETVAAGRHEIIWNGRDETGRTAPAGIYFYRLDAGDFTETRRMTLVK
jgi:beta-glucanase (GH16 family)